MGKNTAGGVKACFRPRAADDTREGSFEAALYNAINFPFGAGMGRVGAAADKFKAELAQNPVSVRWADTFSGR